MTLFNSYGPGQIREQLSGILVEAAPQMLDRIITARQVDRRDLPWLKVAPDGAVRIVIKKLLKLVGLSPSLFKPGGSL